MAWNNAPTLNKLAASQQGGNRGAQLWGVDQRGKLYTTYQTTPGGDWSNWLGPDWAGPNHPQGVFELAASQLPDGRTQFWALDLRQRLWSTWQKSPGGNWSPWKQEWGGVMSHVRYKKMAAAPSNNTAHFLGISEDGVLITCNLMSGDNWSPWTNLRATPRQSRWIEVTACQQHDGSVGVWALDTERQLWSIQRTNSGWGEWQGPNWKNAPRLRNVVAVKSYSGTILFAQDEQYRITALQQNSPGNQHWTGWLANWMGGPESYELAVAGQNNGSVHLWVITLKGKLSGFGQRPPNHGWYMGWSDRDDDPYPTPPAPKPKPPKQ